jgi:hypothetical protein
VRGAALAASRIVPSENSCSTDGVAHLVDGRGGKTTGA